MTVPTDMLFAVNAPALGLPVETSTSTSKLFRLQKGTGRGQAPFGFSDHSEARARYDRWRLKSIGLSDLGIEGVRD